jgi:hypothetical protein
LANGSADPSELRLLQHEHHWNIEYSSVCIEEFLIENQ